MGRNASGVKAISLEGDDCVVGMDLVDKDAKVLLVTKMDTAKGLNSMNSESNREVEKV
jgi:DNA gyrase subunit A (EC 5.99.1.3)